MTKICEYCTCEFKPHHSKSRYCSHECASMARRKLTFEKYEAEAARLGITIDALKKRIRRGRQAILMAKKPKPKIPKTYAEIKAYNRAHPIVTGWRGGGVLGGGGPARHNEVPLRPCEYARYC